MPGLYLRTWWDHCRHSLCVIIGKDLGNGKYESAAPVALKFVPWPAGEAAEPTIQIPMEMATEFLAEARKAIEGTGIKILEDNEAILRARAAEAELKAVREHLEDMRSLNNLRDKPGALK